MSRTITFPRQMPGIEVSLSIGCKLACHYCPQSALIKNYTEKFPNADRVMSFETFKTILTKLTPGCGIGICGMVEPFHNPSCSKMMEYAYMQGYHLTMGTTLQGATWDDIRILEKIDINPLLLHVPDQDMNSRFDLTTEWLEIFDYVNEHFDNIIYSCHGQPHDLIKDKIKATRVLNNEMHNRAGNLEYDEFSVDIAEGKTLCALKGIDGEIYGWTPNVLPNGAVILCCNDYELKHVLGNVVEQEWSEIFTSDPWLDIENGWQGKNQDFLCKTCSFIEKQTEETIMYCCMLKDNLIRTSFMYGKLTMKSEIARMLIENDAIVIWGLGKLFSDSYFIGGWSNIIHANYFTDSSVTSRKKMQDEGVHEVIEPQDILKLDHPLVVTYVRDDAAIRERLYGMGITSVINIYDIFKMSYDIEKK